ncbi:MAG: DUF2721 domain-containing protein [Ignavibacteriales bacterium]|nr:DUF2721 domain-containing protein [Ignavibacteriales bacterium]
MNQILPESMTVTQVIQLLIAPAVMINACGLLLLGINNKYSLVVNRVRLLNEEKRKMVHKVGEKNFTYEENVRLESITRQLKDLVYRVKLVRNSVLCYTSAVALFVLTSLLTGFNFFVDAINLKMEIIGVFLAGMIMVLVGICFAFLETKKGYDIILYEVFADE